MQGGAVVAVGEAAGNDEKLELVEQLWVIAEAVDVEPFRLGALAQSAV